MLFDLEWLCRYPWPMRVRYDNENEFLGGEFQEMLASYEIKPQPTTVKNPQANTILWEQVHLTMADQVYMVSFLYETWQQDVWAVRKAMAWALRSAVVDLTVLVVGGRVRKAADRCLRAISTIRSPPPRNKPPTNEHEEYTNRGRSAHFIIRVIDMKITIRFITRGMRTTIIAWS